MNKKKGILVGFFLCAAICSAVLLNMVLLHIKREDSKDTISRAAVAKMTAALFCNPSELEKTEDDLWYKKYMDYMNSLGYMSDTSGEKAFTYGDLSLMLKNMGISLDEIPGSSSIVRWKSNCIGENEWYNIYNYFITYYQAPVMCLDMTVIGTPSNVSDMAEWTALTDLGYFGFEGIALDGAIDSVVRVLVRDNEIVARLNVVSGDVTYRNVWIKESAGERLIVYMDGITRDFVVPGLNEKLKEYMADIIIENQQVVQLNVKKDIIKGKILSMTDEQIEIEGYGKVPLDADYKIFRLYGGFEEAQFKELVVGYDRQEFIVADGKICGVTISAPLEVKNIRVLIEDTGFNNLFHEQVQVSAAKGLRVVDCTTEQVILETEPKEVLNLSEGNLLSEGVRVRIESKEDTGIRLESVKRGAGVPEYPGVLEVEQRENHYYIVNDVSMEEYLKLVVPSEMPVSYGIEALKVQAVCARSYAYIQLFDRTNQAYGAHVNDSTSYQVYNNSGRKQLADEAVDATCGQVIKYNGNVIEAFYYSTSCGYGTNADIWNADAEGYEYLRAHAICPEEKELDLTDNETFLNFISRRSLNDYDVSAPYYRWRAYLTMEEINQYYGEKAKVGTIQSITIDKRLEGGIAVLLTVRGDQGEYRAEGEYEIRKFLGNYDIYWRNDLESLFQMNYLPSAFVALKEHTYKGQIIGYDIIGGGYGHGVGMSQNATFKMTQKGMDYREIIHFFYDGVSIENLY